MKKIFILVGHPDLSSSAGFFADSYEEGARADGHEVRRLNIGELYFDPILHKGYKEIQALEPDLLRVQEHFSWAEHIVILYPNWWCTMPAVLKGMFDRMFLPGFAFRYKKDKNGNKTMWWEKLLVGKSAHVVVTAGSNPLLIRLFFGDFTNEISKGILGFAGISPVRITTIGPCDRMRPKIKEKWCAKMHTYGRKGR